MSFQEILLRSEQLTASALHAGIAAGIAFGLHLALFLLLDRGAKLSESTADETVLARLRQPLRWAMMAVAIAIAQESDPLLARLWTQISRFLEPALFGWVAYAMVKAFAAVLISRTQAYEDKSTARSRETRVTILSRTATFMIVFITVALILFGIPAVRNIGVTLMASAGVATLAVGAAAQPALKSLIAGMQIATTEPMRIGDYVVVDQEGGRVEDIRLSYVVIRTGDERRLIVPTAKFLDGSFQNWSRVGGGITGSVILPIRPGFALEPIRAAFLAALAENPHWDRRSANLQVSDIRPGLVELKLVMSASGPTALGSLRPAMRETMLDWLRTNLPDALCTES